MLRKKTHFSEDASLDFHLYQVFLFAVSSTLQFFMASMMNLKTFSGILYTLKKTIQDFGTISRAVL